jgi:hypothetical protein
VFLNILNGGRYIYTAHAEAVSNIVSTFCVLLIGILSAVIVLVTGMKDSYFARKYRSSGALKNLLYFYLFTISTVFVTHLLTIASFSAYYLFKLMLAALITNNFQVILIAFICHHVAHQPRDGLA